MLCQIRKTQPVERTTFYFLEIHFINHLCLINPFSRLVLAEQEQIDTMPRNCCYHVALHPPFNIPPRLRHFKGYCVGAMIRHDLLRRSCAEWHHRT